MLLGERPRPLSLGLRARVLFGSPIQPFGWIFGTVGMIFVWALGLPHSVALWVVHPRDLVPVTATVVESHPTNMSINKVPVFKHTVAWTIEGQEHRGVAFTTGSGPGQNVPLRAQASRTQQYVEVEGMRTTMVDTFILFVLLFPGIGLSIVITSVTRNARALTLLKNGRPAKGKFLRVEPTNMRVNKQPVMRYWFSYSVQGRNYEVSGDSLDGRTLTDDVEEPVLYHRDNPGRAVLLGALAGDPRLNEDGGFTTSGGAGSVVLPILFVIVNVLGAAATLL